MIWFLYFNIYILFAMALPTTHIESEQSSHLKLLQTVKSIRIYTMHAMQGLHIET